jgi:hypothetical protein
MDASSALRAALAGVVDTSSSQTEQLTGLLAAVEAATTSGFSSWSDENGRICIQHNPAKSYHEQAPPKLFTAKVNVTTGEKYYYSNKHVVDAFSSASAGSMAAVAGAGAASQKEPASHWTCTVCTLMNENMTALACDACASERVDSAATTGGAVGETGEAGAGEVGDGAEPVMLLTADPHNPGADAPEPAAVMLLTADPHNARADVREPATEAAAAPAQQAPMNADGEPVMLLTNYPQFGARGPGIKPVKSAAKRQ